MPSFELERNIPPSEVTLDLIRLLQRVLLEDVAPRSSGGRQEKERFGISIVDSFGEESISRIEEYRPLLLPDTTSAISIRYSSPYEARPDITVRLAFSLEPHMSRFQVQVVGDAARDVALGVADLLTRVLEPQRRAHAWFHLGVGFVAARFVVGFAALLVAVREAREAPDVATAGLAVALLCWTHWFVGASIRPYMVFDSQRSRRLGSVWNWLVFGTLTFLIFGSALYWLRRQFIGF